MSLKKTNPKTSTKTIELLNLILEKEISGVVRYLHYSLMVRGPNRIPIVKWFHEQAMEAFQHSTQIGEKITALGGHPSLKVDPIPETDNHDVMTMLKESLDFEGEALELYKKAAKLAQNDIALEEMLRDFVRQETEHQEEVEKMIRRPE